MKRLFSVIVFSFAACLALAAETGEQMLERNLYYFEHAQDEVQKIGAQCADCGAFFAGKPSPPGCQAAWDKFYTKKSIDIRVLFGYLDFGKSVHDLRIAQAFMDMLSRRCEPGVNVCGFRHDPDDMNYFVKTVVHNGKKHTVRLRVDWSAASDDDDQNAGRVKNVDAGRTDLRDEQAARTKAMEDLFQDSLVNADATFYFGHARYGAGPDFGPPRRARDGITRDVYYYKHHHPSKDRMLKTLAASAKHTKLLGLFACEAGDLFGDEIRKAAPDSGTLMPQGLGYPESSVAQLYGALDSVLGRRCKDQFESAANVLKTIEVRNEKNKIENLRVDPVRLHGFF